MRICIQSFSKLMGLALGISLLLLSQIAVAQGNSQGNGNGNGNGYGKNNNIGVGNASDGISASIVTAKDIFYTGDPLAISLRFNRGADLVNGGDVDAYLVIFAPSNGEAETDPDTDTDSTDTTAVDTEAALGALTDAVVLPVSDQASEDEQKLFELEAVDIAALPAGTYQLGLILTNPGGDPLVINDWFKGLLGLIDIVGLTVSDEALPFDEDMDGEVDDDADGDGFSDDDSDEDSDDDSDDDPDSDTSGT